MPVIAGGWVEGPPTPNPPPPPPGAGEAQARQPLALAGAAAAQVSQPPPPGSIAARQALTVTASAVAETQGGPPPPPGAYAHIFAISDVQVATGGAWVTQANAVRNWITTTGFDMIINIGDETNAHGMPPSGGSWPWYIPVWDSRKASVRPCHGSNTHVQLGEWQAYYGRSASQYYWEIGGWRVINVDSNSGAASMSSFINANAVTTQPTIVCWHEPPWSGGDRHAGGNASLRPVFATCVAKGVELVLCGHVHLYERYPRMSGSGAADAVNGTRLIVVGTAGQANEAWTSSSPVPMEAHFTGPAAGATELKLYKDHYTWFYKDVMLGSGGAGSYTDSGSQNVRHPIP